MIPAARRLHAWAPKTDDLGFGESRFQSVDEVGGVKVAAGFASGDEDAHGLIARQLPCRAMVRGASSGARPSEPGSIRTHPAPMGSPASDSSRAGRIGEADLDGAG